MFKKIKAKKVDLNAIPQFPHCDPRILHAPGECEFCDKHADWQQLRILWNIAFTGWTPEEGELPCPADFARGDNHTKWGGNRAVKSSAGCTIAFTETLGTWYCTREEGHEGPCAAVRVSNK